MAHYVLLKETKKNWETEGTSKITEIKKWNGICKWYRSKILLSYMMVNKTTIGERVVNRDIGNEIKQ